ncbi:hypothetical protein BH11BAC2_BH11BAC2_10730 [soil metagenome]
METVKPYTLYVLKENPYFERGVLVQLRTDPDPLGYFIPDIGNGTSGFLQKEQVFICADLSENIPPANCMVSITQCYRVNKTGKIEGIEVSPQSGISIFKSIHFQRIRISLPEDFQEIKFLTFSDRLKGFDHYELTNPTLENLEGQKIISVEISHIPPGFYQLQLMNEANEKLMLNCIKFYPESYNHRYEEFLNKAIRKKLNAKEEIKIQNNVNTCTKNSHLPIPTGDNGQQFTSEILNNALTLLTEWGENYCKPINDRLSKKFPHLTVKEITDIIKYGRAAESYIYQMCEKELNGEITENQIFGVVKMKYSWIDDEIIWRLKGIGMFYARK